MTAPPAEPRLELSGVWPFVAGGLVCFHLGTVLWPTGDGAVDFATFWEAARAWVDRGDVYAAPPSDDIEPYAYPPVLAALVRPLAALPLATAQRVWGVLDVALAVLAVGALGKALAPTGWLRATSALLALLLVFPAQLVGTSLGQVHSLVAALATGTLLALARDRHGLAGALLGLAAALKAFPAALGALLLRPWSARGLGLAAATVAFLGAALAPQWAHWVTEVLPDPGGRLPVASQHVMSLPAVGQRLFLPSAHAVPVAEAPAAALGLTLALELGLLALAVPAFLAARTLPDRWALVTVAMLLASPAVGWYHANLALLAFVATYLRLQPDALVLQRRPGLGLAVVGLLLLVVPVDYGLFDVGPSTLPGRLRAVLHTGWGTLLLSPHVFGLGLLLLGLRRAVRSP